jgi:uncharacterized protein YecE (DUF72 family)
VLEGWAEQVPAGFRFALKASRRITHIKRLRDVADETGYLLRTASALGERLGAILFQLPPNLRLDLERLDRFLELLPHGTRAAFEFRHPSWRDAAVCDRLGARDLALVTVEVEDAADEGTRVETQRAQADAGRAGVGVERARAHAERAGVGVERARAHAERAGADVDSDAGAAAQTAGATALVATASFGYLRLRRPGYARAELAAWAARIAAEPWREAFVFFKHEDAAAGPRLAEELLALAARAEEARGAQGRPGVRKAAQRPRSEPQASEGGPPPGRVSRPPRRSAV